MHTYTGTRDCLCGQKQGAFNISDDVLPLGVAPREFCKSVCAGQFYVSLNTVEVTGKRESFVFPDSVSLYS